MNTTLVTAARALTICITTTLAFDAAYASAATLSSDQSVTGAPRQYVVRFPDLDLSRIEGATALYARLGYAARVVCGPLQTRWFPKDYRTCIDRAIAEAVASVNSPILSQYHQSRTKGDGAGPATLAKAR